MHFCTIHLDDDGAPPGADEEVYVVVPGTAKTAIAVALDGLPRFLALLEQAVCATTLPQCPVCRADVPTLRVCPGAHCEAGDPG